MTKTMNRKMNKTMTAACAGAASCCVCAASHTVILSVLGAMIMASIIIICALVLLVLAAFPYAPLARITANTLFFMVLFSFLYISGDGEAFIKPTKRRTKP